MDAHQRGRFIAFEGIDGSGKSTQIRLLADRLRTKGIRVHETCEPTDGPIGSLIHQMMTGRIRGHHKTIAALFVADRLDHLVNDVDGMLAKVDAGVTVLTDRYYFSSYAYHGAHLPMDWVIKANSMSADILRPDLNIFLDVPPEKCLSRLMRGRSQLELYEDLEVMRGVRDKYQEAFGLLRGTENVRTINADKSADVLQELVWAEVRGLFSD